MANRFRRVRVIKEKHEAKVWIPEAFAELKKVLAIQTPYGWVGDWLILELLEGPTELNELNPKSSVYQQVKDNLDLPT